MAKIVNPYPFNFTGKLGNIIGVNRGGKIYYKTAPQGSRPQTQHQKEQGAKFSLAMSILGPMRSLFEQTFKSTDPWKSGYSLAMSLTLSNAITGTYPDYEIDWPKLKISKGRLAPAMSPAAIALAGKIAFSWSPYSPSNCDRNDNVVLVVYAPALKQSTHLIHGFAREACYASIDTRCFKGQDVHTYIAFISENQKQVSNSTYTGMIKAV